MRLIWSSELLLSRNSFGVVIVLDSAKRVNVVIVVGPLNRFDSMNTSSFVRVVIAEFANSICSATFDGRKIFLRS